MLEPIAVTVLSCSACGALDPGPRDLCAVCGRPEFAEKDVAGEGKLVSWTTIRRAPTRFSAQAPYMIAVVDLAAGVRLTGRLRGPIENLQLGVTVLAVERENATYVFEERRA